MGELILVLLGSVILLIVIRVIDGYEHPTCPLCGHNLFCKRRLDKRIIVYCDLHEDVTGILEIT